MFKRRISRAQQDAHEFLQVVAETLAEEHHRLQKLEREAERLRKLNDIFVEEAMDSSGDELNMVIFKGTPPPPTSQQLQQEDGNEFVGMPLEGRLVSEIECQTCGFKPKPTVSTFVVLTLPVPQKVCCNSIDIQ